MYKKELEKIRKLEQQIYDLEICLLNEQQQPLNVAFDSSNSKLFVNGQQVVPCNGMSFKIEPQNALIVTFDGKGQIYCQQKEKNKKN